MAELDKCTCSQGFCENAAKCYDCGKVIKCPQKSETIVAGCHMCLDCQQRKLFPHDKPCMAGANWG